MHIGTLCRTGLCLWMACQAQGLRAGAWEIGGSFATGRESKGTIASNGGFPTIPYTIVQNSFRGAWNQGGVQLGYEVFRRGAWGLWLQGQYSESLAHPGIYHSGENIATGSATTEVFNGTTSYKSRSFGLGVTRSFPFGDIGVSIGPRSHDLSAEGNRQNRINTTFTYDQYRVSHAYRDTFASLSFTLVQKQQGFRSFQKISYGRGFGSTVPAVNPGPSDWRMSEAYLAQFRPNQEFRITLGVRL